MITDKMLQDLGLVSDEPGYYNINEDVTIDVEGVIRIDCEYTTRPVYIAQLFTVEEVKLFIKCINR